MHWEVDKSDAANWIPCESTGMHAYLSSRSTAKRAPYQGKRK